MQKKVQVFKSIINPRIWGYSSDGHIQYISLTKDRVNEALKLVRSNCFPNEGISRAIGLPKHPEAMKQLDPVLLDAMKDGVSVAAIDCATDKMIGCYVNKIYTKSHGAKKIPSIRHPSAVTYLKVSAKIDRAVDCFALFSTDCYMEVLFGSVLPEFRNKGIGQKLITLPVEIGRCLQCGENVKVPVDGAELGLHPVPTVVIGVATSPVIRTKMIGYGYKEIFEIGSYALKLHGDDGYDVKMPAVSIFYQ